MNSFVSILGMKIIARRTKSLKHIISGRLANLSV
jgi:hypothetical protein